MSSVSNNAPLPPYVSASLPNPSAPPEGVQKVQQVAQQMIEQTGVSFERELVARMERAQNDDDKEIALTYRMSEAPFRADLPWKEVLPLFTKLICNRKSNALAFHWIGNYISQKGNVPEVVKEAIGKYLSSLQNGNNDNDQDHNFSKLAKALESLYRWGLNGKWVEGKSGELAGAAVLATMIEANLKIDNKLLMFLEIHSAKTTPLKNLIPCFEGNFCKLAFSIVTAQWAHYSEVIEAEAIEPSIDRAQLDLFFEHLLAQLQMTPQAKDLFALPLCKFYLNGSPSDPAQLGKLLPVVFPPNSQLSFEVIEILIKKDCFPPSISLLNLLKLLRSYANSHSLPPYLIQKIKDLIEANDDEDLLEPFEILLTFKDFHAFLPLIESELTEHSVFTLAALHPDYTPKITFAWDVDELQEAWTGMEFSRILGKIMHCPGTLANLKPIILNCLEKELLPFEEELDEEDEFQTLINCECLWKILLLCDFKSFGELTDRILPLVGGRKYSAIAEKYGRPNLDFYRIMQQIPVDIVGMGMILNRFNSLLLKRTEKFELLKILSELTEKNVIVRPPRNKEDLEELFFIPRSLQERLSLLHYQSVFLNRDFMKNPIIPGSATRHLADRETEGA